MAKKTSIGILGATSYTGVELVRLLAGHPMAAVDFVSSRSSAGERFDRVFPEARNMFDAVLVTPDQVKGRKIDCLFSCLPHAVSADLCLPFIEKGVRVIDLSADFRLKDPAVYESWYRHKHPAAHLLKESVYGLPENYRDRIAKAGILANPGCYVTGALLPLLPLFKAKGPAIEGVIVDAKSGASGAGRTLRQNTHFCEANENFSAYALCHAHRHTPEIEQELSSAAGHAVTITFSPHLLPVNRGILSTIYIKTPLSADECRRIVSDAYEREPFVRLRGADDLPDLHNVARTNYCDIAFAGGGNHPVIAVSALDNLVKGASGQAVQNMNIMFGFPETAGLLPQGGTA